MNFQDSKMEETADCGKTLVQEGGMWEDFWYLTLNHYFSYFSIQYLKKTAPTETRTPDLESKVQRHTH